MPKVFVRGGPEGVKQGVPVCISSPRYWRISNPPFVKVAGRQETQIAPDVSCPGLTFLGDGKEVRHEKRLGCPIRWPGDVLRKFEHRAVAHDVGAHGT